MSKRFINEELLSFGPWQAMERAVARLMEHGHYTDVRVIGRTGDGGADISGVLNGRRWVVQVKFRGGGSLDVSCIDEILLAQRRYHADIPVVATNVIPNNDFVAMVVGLQRKGIPIQLWDKTKLLKDFEYLEDLSSKLNTPRSYQERPIQNIVNNYLSFEEHSGIVIMATGLGKTFVVAEAIRRILKIKGSNLNKILVLAHTNELVYQLERSFWPFLGKYQPTAVWNGNEKGDVANSAVTFACIDSVVNQVDKFDFDISDFNMVVIDEAHHAGSPSYLKFIKFANVGNTGGPYLLGMSATPWRSDENDISLLFKKQLCRIDIIEGMKNGYLSNVDYRMHVDNVDWNMLANVKEVTPKALNKTIFIKEWDEAVIEIIGKTMKEIAAPKTIVFCATIEHAIMMQGKLNALRTGKAGVIYSGAFNGRRMSPIERSLALCDFADGRLDIMCAVDIFNEGIDVPDVNLIVFQRVTHSRRIFVQQLGRGLRISQGKDKVIVLDFVSDIRRFAAGLDMKTRLGAAPRYLKLGNPIRFVNRTGDDPRAESFLRAWLEDAAKIEEAKDNDHILKFPPELSAFGLGKENGQP